MEKLMNQKNIRGCLKRAKKKVCHEDTKTQRFEFQLFFTCLPTGRLRDFVSLCLCGKKNLEIASTQGIKKHNNGL
jgi:hypothetical protein